MNPVCASCKKTVYPMEKLNCLDKFWHKGCFRCSTCSMTLNMKNYKGYDKMPYCAAHYPTTKFTAVADTPENLRLKQNTNNQSILTYHADYEKMKGTKQTIADDLETLRASKSAQIASEVSYRGVKVHRDEQEMHRPEQAIDDGPPQNPSYVPVPPQGPVPKAAGPGYRAIYDYTAADEDEISFVEGDIIKDVTVIDDGWMEGRNARTGQYGMLPSNYVERV